MNETFVYALIVICVCVVLYFIFSRSGKSSNKRSVGSDTGRDGKYKSQTDRERDTVKRYGGETEQLNRDNRTLRKKLRDDIAEQQKEGFIIRENNRSARESNKRIKEILNNAKDL